MISVQNHRPPLSGNKFGLFAAFLLLLLVTSCGIFQKKPTKPEKQPKPVEHPEPSDTIKVGDLPDLPKDSLDLIYPRVFKETYKVAVALPFFYEPEERVNSRNNLISRVASEYYWGMQLAFDTLTNCGANYDLYVFDTKNDSITADNILGKLLYDNVDAIVGPLLKKNLVSFYNFSARNRINLLTPIYYYSDSTNPNPYYFNTMPSEADMARRAADWANKKLNVNQVDRILILRQPLISEKDIADEFISSLDSSLRKLVREKTVTNNGLLSGISADYFGDSTIIFVPSDNELFINTFFSVLRRSGKSASVVGLAKWMEFKTLEPELMARYNLHLLTSYYIDYENDDVKSFIGRYREKYHTEPSEYAFRGYDDALWLGRQMFERGAYFQRNIMNNSFPTLHSEYNFRQNKPTLDYRNKQVIMLRFNNYELVKVK